MPRLIKEDGSEVLCISPLAGIASIRNNALAGGDMLTPILQTIFRGFLLALVLIAVTALNFVAGTAWGAKVALSGTYSQTSILASCTKAGGQFNSDDSGFGCSTDKGSVQCTTNGKCTGECATCGKGPAIAHKAGSVFGVLSGTTLKAAGIAHPQHGPGSSHNPIVENSNKPVRQISEEHLGRRH
jgi:hypothetical protein